MQWSAAGYEQTLAAVQALLNATPWPGPPAGFTALTPPRPMRAVLRGTLEGPHGEESVVLKWSRPDAVADRVSRRLRGGKGPREGRTLRAMGAAGVRVPKALGFSDEGEDLLVTAALPHLASPPAADDASPDLIRATAALLARAHAAGLRHRDLHHGNLGLVGDEAAPALVDLGGARVGAALTGKHRRRALARLRHGLLGQTRRSQCLRALVAYMQAVHGDRGRKAARAAASELEVLARVVARHYRRGRDRRATRAGKHFETFEGVQVARAIRRREGTSAAWHAHAETWLENKPSEARPLKAGGGVVRVAVPGDDRAVVLKQFDAVAPGRLPRALRAFRRAHALENRHLPVPRALLAVARADGSSLCVSAWIDAPNLHEYSAGGRGGAMASLSRTARRGLLVKLGRLLRTMHAAEVTHRDLKAPNLLVRADEGETSIWLADLEGVRIRRRTVPWARRARDLARLDASLDARRSDRLLVLRAYMDVLPRPPVSLRAMARRIAQHVRKKRGPTGRPK